MVRNHAPLSSALNEKLERVLNSVSEIFSLSRSRFSREVFARQHLPYTAPQEHKFSPQCPETFQCVPIPAVLKNVLEVPHITDMVFSPTPAQQGHLPNATILTDFRDGTIYKNLMNIIGPSEINTIFLLLYADEVEICNPLGAKRDTHKLFLVYFSILNIHAAHRSQLKAIHLALVARHEHVTRHGHQKVFMPIVEDLLQLKNEGLTLQTERGIIQAKALVLAFCGDNLSMHSIGGFNTSFAKGRICRFCMAHSDNIKSLTNESKCVLRKDHTHADQLSSIAINEDVRRVYGVSKPSPLLSLEYFSVCTQLLPDVMHDIFEGTVSHVLRNVLNGLVSDSVLSVADLDRISTFCYGYYDRKNRPEQVTQSFVCQKGGLKGSASQKWCLLRLLPLIFFSSIPEGNHHWEIYLEFREIADMVLAEEVPLAWVPYLQHKIEQFLQNYMGRYPASGITPKMHYLVHYPRIMSQLGPLTQYWCMRFEAKHQYFKRLSSRTMNFRNICKTMASRHQLLQGYQLHGLGTSNVSCNGA
ncbi:uncharacterized protein [Dermacentor andersoni]|uniref:uncharacterized protein n=1 Tax=Dermacentor andersoni TaxID=34620 RepID=UPI002155B0C1|nr:uncharacterized protein LOC126535415 [Dermacentor andersoni]